MPQIALHSSAQEAAQVVARHISDLIRKRSAMGKHLVLGLATGSTPLPLYAELVRLHREEGLSFKKVITFNLDEYEGLDGSQPQSYRYYMNEHLFNQIDIPLPQTHIPDGKSANLEQTCAAYEAAIQQAGGLDLQILGIGSTGHIGFNEPPSARDSRTRRVHLDAKTRQDNAIFFKQPGDVPHGAITMGVATILEAREIALLALGPNKAAIIKRALTEKPHALCPATWLQEHPACTFHLDAASSSLV
jgi:glucosamine-6-phosphate deaminase